MLKLKYFLFKKNLKRLLPAFAGTSVLAISLIMWQVFTAQEVRQAERVIKTKAAAVSHYIRDGVESRMFALERMARSVEARTPSKNEWEHDVRLNTLRYPGYRFIEWVDLSYKARWQSQGKDSRSMLGELLKSDSGLREALAIAARSRQPVLTGPVLSEGGKWLLAGVPVFKGGKPQGFIIGAFRTDDLFNSILHNDAIGGYSVVVSHRSEELFKNYPELQDEEGMHMRQMEEVHLYGASWLVTVRPDPVNLLEVSWLPMVPLFIGPLLALTLFMSIFFAQRAGEREKEVMRANSELKEENIKRTLAEERASKHAEALERSNAELEQFAYVASHDLQEPLRMISGYLQLLEKRYKGRFDNDADAFINHAVKSASRMQMLIKDILAYSRVGSGDKKTEQVDLNGVLAHVLADLSASVDESGAVVTYDPLPIFTSDSSQMYHLLMNLIGNAIKYRGLEPPRIHIGVKRMNGEWLVSVMDNGIGMEMKHSVRIFDVFQRLHGNDTYSGTGIGLAICKKVVEGHGGRIWVESSLGSGSTFYFTIPDRKP